MAAMANINPLYFALLVKDCVCCWGFIMPQLPRPHCRVLYKAALDIKHRNFGQFLQMRALIWSVGRSKLKICTNSQDENIKVCMIRSMTKDLAKMFDLN